MTPKTDFERLVSEVNRNKNLISDMDYTINNLTAKINERIDKIDTVIIGIKSL